MSTLSHFAFRCHACLHEKDGAELYSTRQSQFILCKSCAAIGKYCPACKIYKDLAEFNKASRGNRGTTGYCKLCRQERYRKEYNPGKNRAHKLSRRFNLTQVEYDEMFRAQGGLCAICKHPETALDNTGKRVRALAVDHNHKTGAIRQLLCGSCNYLLGYVKEDIEVLQAASEYLKNHER